MKPRSIAIACGVAGVAVGLAAATGIVYHKQIKSAASLKRLTGYADGYDLYAIDIAYDYDLDRIIAAGVRDDQAYIDAVVAQVLPGVPVHVQAPQFACSAFVAVDAEGRVRTGRNYDFKDDTSALLVRNHPRGGYASIGFAALNNLGANTPLDSVTGRAAALMARLPSSTVLTNAACPLPYSPWIPSPVTRTRNAPSSIPRSPSAWCSTVPPPRKKLSTCFPPTTCTPWQDAITTSLSTTPPVTRA